VGEPQRLDDFLSWKPKKLKSFLSHGLMYEGSRLLLYGKYKSMKSMLAIRFALAMATGCPWLGFDGPDEGASVLHLQLEIPHQLLQNRVIQMTCGRDTTKKSLYFWTEHFVKLDADFGMSLVKRQIEKLEPEILVVDPIYKVISGNLLDAHAATQFLDRIDQLMADYPISVLMVNHTRKGVQDEDVWGSDDMIGSSIFSNWADSVIRISKEVKERQTLITANFDVLRHAAKELEPREFTVTKDLDFKLISNIMKESK